MNNAFFSFSSPRVRRVLLSTVAVVIFAAIFLVARLDIWRDCAGTRYPDQAWETSKHIIFSDYILFKYGRGYCFKVMDKATGSVIFQETLPGSFDNEVGLVGDTFIGRAEGDALIGAGNALITFNLDSWEYRRTNLKDVTGGYASWRITDGKLVATDLEGNASVLDPFSLTSGTTETIAPLTETPKVSSRSSGAHLPFYVSGAPRSSLHTADGSLILEDVDLVYPRIQDVLQIRGRTVIVLVSSETIERERWILTGLDQAGKQLWQVRQSDAAKTDSWFKKKDRHPIFESTNDQEIIFLFDGRAIFVNALTGAWRIVKTYR